jgi:outer membrane protein TolC
MTERIHHAIRVFALCFLTACACLSVAAKRGGGTQADSAAPASAPAADQKAKAPVVPGPADNKTQAITLDEALQIAFKNSPDLRAALSEVENSRGAVSEAKAQFNPTFTAHSTTTYQGPIATMQMGSENIAMAASPDTTAGLSIALPLDVSRRLAYSTDVARYRFQVQYLTLLSTSEKLIETVKTAYYELLRTQGEADAAKADLDDAKAQLEVIRAEREEGISPQYDVTSEEVQVENLNQQYIVAQNAVSLAQSTLNAAMGIAVDTPTEIAPVKVEVTVKSVDVAGCIKLALQKRPEIKAALATLASSQTNVKLQRAGYLPSLSISGGPSYDLNATGLGAESYSWTAALSLSFPIWDGGVTKAKVSEAKSEAKYSEAGLASEKITVATEVRQAALNLQEAALRTETTARAVALAEDALSIATDRYEAGIAVLVEVTNAQSSLTQARVNEVNARYDYAVAVAQLEKATSSQPELKNLQLLADPSAEKKENKGARP